MTRCVQGLGTACGGRGAARGTVCSPSSCLQGCHADTPLSTCLRSSRAHAACRACAWRTTCPTRTAWMSRGRSTSAACRCRRLTPSCLPALRCWWPGSAPASSARCWCWSSVSALRTRPRAPAAVMRECVQRAEGLEGARPRVRAVPVGEARAVAGGGEGGRQLQGAPRTPPSLPQPCAPRCHCPSPNLPKQTATPF